MIHNTNKTIVMLFYLANIMSYYSSSMIYRYISLILILIMLLKTIILFFTVLYLDAKENIFIPLIVFTLSTILFTNVSYLLIITLYIFMLIITLLHVLETKYVSWKNKINQHQENDELIVCIKSLFRSAMISIILVINAIIFSRIV